MTPEVADTRWPSPAPIFNQVSGSADFNGDNVNPNKIDFGPRFAGSFAGGVAATVVRQVVYGGGKMNFSQVAADAFGNAVGQALLPGGAGQQQVGQLSDWLVNRIDQEISIATPASTAPVQDVGPQLTDNGVRFTSQEVEGVANDAGLSDRVFRDDGAGGLSEITAEDRDRDRLLGRISDQIYAQDQADVQQARLAAAAQRATTAGVVNQRPSTGVLLASAEGIGGTVTDAGPVSDDALQSAFTLTMTPQERDRVDRFDASIRQFKEGILDKIRDQTPTSFPGRASLSGIDAAIQLFAPNDSGDLIMMGGGVLGGALSRAGRIFDKIAEVTNRAIVQVRAQALLDGAPGLNFTAKADGVEFRINMAGGKVDAGTAVTDSQAFESIIGPIPSTGNSMTITAKQAAVLEKAIGLPTGRISQQGGVLSVVSDVAARAPRSPVTGNGLFLDGGRGLPGGGPEINIAPINTAGGGGIRQIVVKAGRQ